MRKLTRLEWQAAWDSLPPDRRDPYSDPSYHDVYADWISATPECLSFSQGPRFALYSYLRCPIDEMLTDGRPLFDAQTCYGYGGPIFHGDWTAAGRRNALHAFREYLAADDVVAEFVRLRTQGVHLPDFAESGYELRQVRTNVEYHLQGSSGESLPNDWNKRASRNVKLSLRNGLAWELGSLDDIEEFARIYRLTAERRSMAPFYRFDSAHLASLLRLHGGRTQLVLVRDGATARVVAGSLLLMDSTTVYYHLGASDPLFLHLRPNDHLVFAITLVAYRHGVTRITWGGGLGNDPNDNLFQYKSRFGNRFVPVYIAGRVVDATQFEQLCTRWSTLHPDQAGSSRFFLRYRQ